MRKITQLNQENHQESLTFVQLPLPKRRVAAYARVSVGTPQTRQSLRQQVNYYEGMIRENAEWEFAGIYVDEAVSGAEAARREGFQQMIEACGSGKVDLILVKSISRFARNTLDLLKYVRQLKRIGVEVWFEEQKLSSVSSEGELMLTLLASFAQAELEAVSENSKWAVRKGFQQGRPGNHNRLLGYRWEQNELVIVPEEAVIIQRIFSDFLNGKSRTQSARELTADGYRTIHGKPLLPSSISYILRNPTYTGNMLLQKTYVENPISKKKHYNHGELPQYYVKNNHPAIIDREVFERVQQIMTNNRLEGKFPYQKKSR